jgi:hypothetical protein
MPRPAACPYRPDEERARSHHPETAGRGPSGTTTAGVSTTQPPEQYEITVEGILDPRWSAWFGGLQLASDDAGRTTITGPVADQAALHGLLTRIRDLGLTLLTVRRTDE